MDNNAPIQLNDILAIEGNMPAHSRLRKYLRDRDAIAFVGAGASVPLYPLWDPLIRQLADEALNRGRTYQSDYDFWLRNASNDAQQVTRGIRDSLRGLFEAILAGIFGPKQGADGNYYTPAHGALMRMSFGGYVTTNYDSGLLEARLHMRPEAGATDYATWKDAGFVNAWLTDEVFEGENRCPVLFAHGIYQRTDTIVLGVAEYRDAYQPGAYRRLFEKLWTWGRLVFVGYGFKDSWLKFLADEVLTLCERRATAEPQHIAIIGLPESEKYTPEMRKMFVDGYNAEPLFYPVRTMQDGGEDHSALLTLLESLATPAASIEPSPQAPAVVPIKPAVHERWVHDAPANVHYIGRETDLGDLDRLAKDAKVRVVAVTGMAGLGKTALIVNWLKKYGGAETRQVKGLFYWSFYANRGVADFLAKLIEFAVKDLRVPEPMGEESRVARAVRLIEAVAMLIVLDGMEVMQQEPASAGHGVLLNDDDRANTDARRRENAGQGTVLDDDLRAFLDEACRCEHAGLIVLASRCLVFPDMAEHLGSGFHQIDLEGLKKTDGAALLEGWGVRGTDEDRTEIATGLQGHPLALRVFAGALATQHHGDPTRFWRAVVLGTNDPLHMKLRRLLSFYDRQMGAQRSALMGIISLFNVAVLETVILRLARTTRRLKAIFKSSDDASLRNHLEGLHQEKMLTREYVEAGAEYACHPVLRDYFGGVLLRVNPEVGVEAAGLLTGQRGRSTPKTLDQMEPVLTAIDLLLDIGYFKEANSLYSARFENGRLFFELPAPHIGARCAEKFVAGQERQRECEKQLGPDGLWFYLNEAGLLEASAGECMSALSYFKDAVELSRSKLDDASLCHTLRNQGEVLINLGRLSNAREALNGACKIARQICPPGGRFSREAFLELRDSLAAFGYAVGLTGSPAGAMAAYVEAHEIQTRIHGNRTELDGLNGIQWADFVLRLGDLARTRRSTEANIGICERKKWTDDVARCHWVLGRLDLLEDQFPTAAEHFKKAEDTFRHGCVFMEIPRVLLARSELHRRRKEWDEAVRCVEEALAIVGPRGLLLLQADGLVLRGRITLDRASDPNARNCDMAVRDGKAALTLARQRLYAWAERDAHALLFAAYDALDNSDEADGHRRALENLDKRLKWPTSA
jgi:tetratricopeptide (TPR) repeat protein